MASNLQAWESYINERISSAIRQLVPTVVVDYGTVSPSSKGWYTVRFSRTFPASPGVVAVQGEGYGSPSSQSLSPPRLAPPTITAPTIPAPSLASLKVSTPTPPLSWGDTVKSVVSSVCGSTIGNIPVIGGYLCSGINDTFGALLAAVANAIQNLYYIYDWQAGASAIEQAVEAKAAADWNANVANLQGALNSFADDVNSGLTAATGGVNTSLADLTEVVQGAINDVWPLIAEAMGLLSGEALPVAKVRLVTTSSFQVLAPGSGVPVYWIALFGET